jgi:hypothetical protein
LFELLKIRLQTTSKAIEKNFFKYNFFKGHRQEANVYQVFRHIIKTEGFRGLFRGLHATIWRDTPTYGNYFI